MAKKVWDLAQQVMDSFYQDFKSEDEFFQLKDFALAVIDENDSRLEDEFYMTKKKSPDLTFIKINPQWTIHEKAEIKFDEERDEWYADVCTPMFEFPLDEYGMGVQDVSPFGSACNEFARLPANWAWSLCMTSTTDMTFYSVEGCRIKLHNFNGTCTKYLDLRVVPSISALPREEQTVSDGKAAQIKEAVLSKMFRDYQIKLGKIKMDNDQNPNPSPNESGKRYAATKTE